MLIELIHIDLKHEVYWLTKYGAEKAHSKISYRGISGCMITKSCLGNIYEKAIRLDAFD
ncbi:MULTISPECIES: hypothetical protein [Flectobacillus]|uniref:hypothetical protein n=1 Tax=Flectobacillus TaxID=101 RepID=UPI001595F216|nr:MULTISPECIES: hypothetical protein [Flectobacillus]MDI9867943.1 hypothetical protein [Flectobacillus roseus]